MSQPRAIIRQEKWSLVPDREPDAEALTYRMECAVCQERSDTSESWQAPQVWALKHSGRNPSHHSFREIITRPWRTFMHNP